MQSSVPAIIISGGLNGLGVIRSLGRGGVVTYLLDRNRFNPGMWSRYARPVTSRGLHGRQLIDALLKFQATLSERPVLISTDEMAVLTISEHRDCLRHAFRFRLPAHDTVLALLDKARFQEFALKHALPVPRGEIIREISDLSRLRALRLPLVVKPADRSHVHSGDVPRLLLTDRLEGAVTACEWLLKKTSALLVQEHVDGPDSSIY